MFLNNDGNGTVLIGETPSPVRVTSVPQYENFVLISVPSARSGIFAVDKEDPHFIILRPYMWTTYTGWGYGYGYYGNDISYRRPDETHYRLVKKK
jgi:hypothetical protein